MGKRAATSRISKDAPEVVSSEDEVEEAGPASQTETAGGIAGRK